MQHNEYVLIMIEFFSKWLKSMSYLYHNMRELLMHSQSLTLWLKYPLIRVKHYVGSSKRHEKTMISHHMISHDHLEIYGLIK